MFYYFTMSKKFSLRCLVLLFWLFFLVFWAKTSAATTLVPWDVFILTANGNPDMIEFVSRVDMTTGTIIRFSDDWRTSTWSWRATEWYISFTSSKTIPRGTIIRLTWLETWTQTVAPSWAGTITKNNTFDLATVGEWILIYQWTTYNQISPTFLYGLGFWSGVVWINTWTPTSNTSYLPASLTIWTTATTIISWANVQYNCTNTALLDSSFVTAINDQNNWNKNPITGAFAPSPCVFDFIKPLLSINLWSGQLDFTSWTTLKFQVTASEPLNTWSFTCSDLVLWWDLWGSATCNSITEIIPFDHTAFEVSVTVFPDVIGYGDIELNISSWAVRDIAWNSNTWALIINNYIIVDVQAPVITLSWAATWTVAVWVTRVDPGATCVDNFDTTCSVVVSGSVNTTVPWVYTIVYSATDDAGNNASVIRTITVVDDAPVVTLQGSGTVHVAWGSSYSEDGAVRVDDVDGTGTLSRPTSGSVDTYGILGTYYLEYMYIDTAGNTGSVIRTVIVDNPPIPAPVADNFTINQDTNLDASTGAHLANDNNLYAVTSWYAVVTPTHGTYVITWMWFIYTPNSWFAGVDSMEYALCNILNECATALITINVIDNQVPIVTLNGSGTVIVWWWESYSENWAIWSDTADGTGVISRPTSGNIDTYGMPGTYYLEYTYVDIAGNTGSAIRTVIVSMPWIPDPQDDVYTINQDTILDLTTSPNVVVINDSGMQYTTSGGMHTAPMHGTIVLTGMWFIYTPNTGYAGTDTLRYELCNILNQCDNALVTITINDTTPPVVTLIGSWTISINQGSGFSDPGASWSDNIDGTGLILTATSGSVNTAIPGTYTLEYTYTDTVGNTWNVVTRSVVVLPVSTTGTWSTWGTTTWTTTIPSGWFAWGWGGSSSGQPVISIPEDNKPVDAWVFNDSIWTTCFTPMNKSTIDQWIAVTEYFKTAHQMLYSYELTKWRWTKDYRPYDTLTREEAARFMVEFAENVLCRKKSKTYENNFSDIWWADDTLVPCIKESYEYGIFKWDPEGTFRPSDIINRDELIAVMIRLVTNEFLPETSDDWAKGYRDALDMYTATHTAEVTLERGNIAENMYSLYKDNTYSLLDVGYVINK